MNIDKSIDDPDDNEELRAAKLLIQVIAGALVKHPDAVLVQAVPQEGGATLQLTVALGDIGQIVGKEGRTARSIRTILVAAGVRAHRRFALNIQTPELQRPTPAFAAPLAELASRAQDAAPAMRKNVLPSG